MTTLPTPPPAPPITATPSVPTGPAVSSAGSVTDAPDCAVFDLTCRATAAADDIFARVVDTVAAGSADLIVATSTWWATTDSVDPRATAVLTAQHATAPVALALLVGGVLVAAIRMILPARPSRCSRSGPGWPGSCWCPRSG